MLVDRADLLRWRFGCTDGDWNIRHGQRPVVLALMRTELIVIADIGLHDVVEMTQAEAEEVIQILAFKRSDPRLREGIGDWRLATGTAS